MRDVVAMQEDAGLPVVNDGELRRESFQSELTASVDGFSGVSIDAWLWGSWHSDELGDKEVGGPSRWLSPSRCASGAASPPRSSRSCARSPAAPTKVTLPSPSLFANLWDPEPLARGLSHLRLVHGGGDRPAVPRGPRAGAGWAARTCSSTRRTTRCWSTPTGAPSTRQRGWTADSWIEYGLALDNAVIEAGEGITFGLHLCKGNQDSRWLVAGGYDAIARPIFRGVHADRLLLEYDDERSGGFEPLREVPEDKVVVLGLVTTKSARAGGPLPRWRRACTRRRRSVGLDRLAVSPQCGFSTSVVGNALTIDDQRRKLALVCEVAGRVWG